MLRTLKSKIFDFFTNARDFLNMVIFVYFTKEYISCIFIDKTNKQQFFFILSHYILLFSFIIAIISAIGTTLYPKNIVLQGSLFISGLVFLFLLIFILPYSLLKSWNLYYKGSYAIFQDLQLSFQEKHVGIIFPHYLKENKEITVGDSIALLIARLSEQKIPSHVYHCFSKDDFVGVYTNPKVTSLWIFGHGKRNLLSLGKNSTGQLVEIEYERLPQVEPKKFIAQLHCNTGNGKSLAEINKAHNSYVSKYFRDLIQNRCYILHFDFQTNPQI